MRALGRKDIVFERKTLAIESAVLGDTVSQGIGRDMHPLSVCQYNTCILICFILLTRPLEGYWLQKSMFVKTTLFEFGFLGEQVVFKGDTTKETLSLKGLLVNIINFHLLPLHSSLKVSESF